MTIFTCCSSIACGGIATVAWLAARSDRLLSYQKIRTELIWLSVVYAMLAVIIIVNALRSVT